MCNVKGDGGKEVRVRRRGRVMRKERVKGGAAKGCGWVKEREGVDLG